MKEQLKADKRIHSHDNTQKTIQTTQKQTNKTGLNKHIKAPGS